jgi:hypothetical protein
VGSAGAFFQAGARAVVGNTWPVGDDEGAEFFDAYHEHICAVVSLGGTADNAIGIEVSRL